MRIEITDPSPPRSPLTPPPISPPSASHSTNRLSSRSLSPPACTSLRFCPPPNRILPLWAGRGSVPSLELGPDLSSPPISFPDSPSLPHRRPSRQHVAAVPIPPSPPPTHRPGSVRSPAAHARQSTGRSLALAATTLHAACEVAPHSVCAEDGVQVPSLRVWEPLCTQLSRVESVREEGQAARVGRQYVLRPHSAGRLPPGRATASLTSADTPPPPG